MKLFFVPIALLLLCTSASFASPPAAPALFSSLGSGGSCPAPMLAAAGQDRGGITTQSTCTANCTGGCTVSCTGQSCWALDGQYVQCDGVNTYCPTTCGCQEGAVQWYDGGCCVGGLQKTNVYECRSGKWVIVDTMCGGTCY